MAVSDVLDKLNPPKRLSLKLKYPEEKTLVLTRNRHGQIALDDEETQLFTLKIIKLHLTRKEKNKRISDGAIAGAFVAAATDRDVLTGTIIGDWWEKQNDKKARRITIELEDIDTKEVCSITLWLRRDQYEKVRVFLKGV